MAHPFFKHTTIELESLPSSWKPLIEEIRGISLIFRHHYAQSLFHPKYVPAALEIHLA